VETKDKGQQHIDNATMQMKDEGSIEEDPHSAVETKDKGQVHIYEDLHATAEIKDEGSVDEDLHPTMETKDDEGSTVEGRM
jgi:hypothetical protein